MATKSKKAGRLCQEAIADPMDRQEMTGCGGIGFKLPRSRHTYASHCSGGWIAIIAPGGIQYYVPRQCTIDILQKEQQKVIFRAGKVYYFAAAHCLSGADIDRHIGETNHVVIDVTGSAGENRAARSRTRWAVSSVVPITTRSFIFVTLLLVRYHL
jgi:hypothetical protein